jgi:hypothetical protein
MSRLARLISGVGTARLSPVLEHFSAKVDPVRRKKNAASQRREPIRRQPGGRQDRFFLSNFLSGLERTQFLHSSVVELPRAVVDEAQRADAASVGQRQGTPA